ncbi:MAG: EAL domain-containing protein [Oscillospiraceae bacterium]|nr:EAL domain-containing protein [Oscillospiraceae bacterium]
MNKKKIYRNVTAVINFIIYICSLIVTSTISGTDVSIDILGVNIVASSLCGIITAFNCVQILWYIIVFKKNGYYMATLMCLMHCTGMIVPFFIDRRVDSLPGIAVVLANFATATFVYEYICKFETTKEFLKNQANTDSLTDLPNRRALSTHIEELIRQNKKFAVSFVDIDDFKMINDTVGHNAGDEVLRMVSHEWMMRLNPSDFLARLGGDEFALVIIEDKSKEELRERINEMAAVLNSDLGLAYEMFRFTASFGVSFYPENGDSYTSLLSCSDAAMYNAKLRGKATVSYYDKSILSQMQVNVSTEKMIKDAIVCENFFMEFQPQYQLEDKKLIGFEALVRIKNKDDIINPDEFIPFAEKGGLIIDIGRWIIKYITTTFRSHVENTGIVISINISAKHLLDASFTEELIKTVSETGFPVKNLEIEITESAFIASIDHAAAVVKKLRDLGIKIAVDDFGTGYASLSYLSRLMADYLKIDKTFIDSIASNENSADFVSMIISMGHIMKMDIIAEGVENESQLEILRKINCDCIQGFLWGRPVSEKTAFEMIDVCRNDLAAAVNE